LDAGPGQAFACSGVAGLAECKQLDALGGDVGAAASAAGPRLGGHDDVDAASLRVPTGGRQRLGPADRDLDRLAAGANPRATGVAVAGSVPELASEQVGA